MIANFLTSFRHEFLLLGKPALILLEPLDLVTFIEELLPLLEGEAIATDVQVLFEHEKAVPVNADAGQLTQVILNLVRNAVQALVDNDTENGMVKISLYQVGNKINLCIEDNGPGFAPGVIDQLFTPFFTTKERGTGLGLAVVKAIIHNHEGEIEAKNSPQGGAVFTITLPVASLEEKEVDVALIMNDKILSYSLEKALKVLDYRVKVLKLSNFKDNNLDNILPKLIVLEESLDKNKLVNVEEICRRWPGIDLVVLGDLLDENPINLEKKGVRIIKKPFEINRIISTINNLKISYKAELFDSH